MRDGPGVETKLKREPDPSGTLATFEAQNVSVLLQILQTNETRS
ncbi:hypothetical protein ACMDCR_28185 [Labrys okinawensis]